MCDHRQMMVQGCRGHEAVDHRELLANGKASPDIADLSGNGQDLAAIVGGIAVPASGRRPRPGAGSPRFRVEVPPTPARSSKVRDCRSDYTRPELSVSIDRPFAVPIRYWYRGDSRSPIYLTGKVFRAPAVPNDLFDDPVKFLKYFLFAPFSDLPVNGWRCRLFRRAARKQRPAQNPAMLLLHRHPVPGRLQAKFFHHAGGDVAHEKLGHG